MKFLKPAAHLLPAYVYVDITDTRICQKGETIMKKYCLSAVALVLLLLCACGLSEEERLERALDELDRNSELPFALTQPEAELGDTSGYGEWQGFGCWGIYNDDVDVTLSGWPDVLDSYHVTDMHLLSPRYSALGLRVGDAAERAEELLESMGYKPLPEVVWGSGDTCYTRDGVLINLEYQGEAISGLTVYVQSTNVEDVDF